MEDAYGAGFDGLGGPGGFDQFNEDFYGDLDAEMTTTNQQQPNLEYDPNTASDDRVQKKYSQIVKRFRIILPEDVEKMLEQNQNRTGPRDGSSPTKKGLLNNNAQNQQQAGFSVGGNDNVNESGTGSKKRSREEMMTGNVNGGPSMIDSSIFNL